MADDGLEIRKDPSGYVERRLREMTPAD